MLSEDIGNNYSLRTENTKTIVEALNEINSKDALASAFGDPLLNTDNYNDMSEKIHDVTNSFKSALLEKGIVSSKYDKINSLITKIKNIPQSVSNSRFASGTILPEYSTTDNKTVSFVNKELDSYVGGPIIINDLGFIPKYFIAYRMRNLYLDFSIAYRIDDDDVLFLTGWCLDKNGNTSEDFVKILNTNDYAYLREESIKIPAWFYENLNTVEYNWVAFGDIEVSEEEIALTESLRDILTEKGVESTSADKLSDLIIKVENLWGVDEKRQIVDMLVNKGIDTTIDDSLDKIISDIDAASSSSISMEYTPGGTNLILPAVVYRSNPTHVMYEDILYYMTTVDNIVKCRIDEQNAVTIINKVAITGIGNYSLLTADSNYVYAYYNDALYKLNNETFEVVKSITIGTYKNPIQATLKGKRILVVTSESTALYDFDLNKITEIAVSSYATYCVEEKCIYIGTSKTFDVYNESGTHVKTISISTGITAPFIALNERCLFYGSSSSSSSEYGTSYYRRLITYNTVTDMSFMLRESGMGTSYKNNTTTTIVDIDNCRMFNAGSYSNTDSFGTTYYYYNYVLDFKNTMTYTSSSSKSSETSVTVPKGSQIHFAFYNNSFRTIPSLYK
jgi:hypothetical protein